MEIITVGLIIVVLIFGFNAWTAFLEKKAKEDRIAQIRAENEEAHRAKVEQEALKERIEKAAKEEEEERIKALAREEAAKRRNALLKKNGFLSEGKWELAELCSYLREHGVERDMFPPIDTNPHSLSNKLSNISEEARLNQNIKVLSRLPIILNSLTTSLKDEAIEYLEKQTSEGRDFPYRISYQPIVANGEGRAILDLGFVGQSDNYSES